MEAFPDILQTDARTPYLGRQDDITLAAYTDRKPAPTDITYTIDATRAIRRNVITHTQYNT